VIATLLCLAFVIAASVTDIRSRKIYNATTYPGLLAALVWNVIGSLWAWQRSSDGSLEEMTGWVGISESLLGFLACGGLMLVCFVFFGVGGGDVKLLAMVGAFLGVQQGIETLLWTFVLGACLGVIVLIWRIGAFKLLRLAGQQFLAVIRLGTALSSEARSELKSELFLAPCAAAGVVIVRWMYS